MAAIAFPNPPAIDQPHQIVDSDRSKKFLNMSNGALMVMITGIVVACCAGTVLAAIGGASIRKSTVTITSCEITDSRPLRTAKIRFTVKNNSPSSKSFTVNFEVRDSGGSRVGSGSKYVWSVDSGQSASDETTIFLNTSGGETCVVVDQDQL